MSELIIEELQAIRTQLASLGKALEAILAATQSNAKALRDAALSGEPLLIEPLPASSSVLKGGESAKRSAPSLTEEQQAIGAQMISNVVRDALDQKRKPSLHDAKCRALTAANAYVAGVLQINRAVSLAAPNRPASK